VKQAIHGLVILQFVGLEQNRTSIYLLLLRQSKFTQKMNIFAK